ncbi:MAG: DUF58 domain-containing protein [Nitrospinae bacterium]|nr:DUF58 domain-containing protein [Nitrospinota bacterium]
MNDERESGASDILKKIRQIEISARKAVTSILSGEYHSIFKGMGMEFAESRPYQPGDDIRTMDWNVTARAGSPFVKTFREERELTLMLIADLSASGHFGSKSKFKAETAAELCATLAFSALRNSDKVGLIAFTNEVELYVAPRKGRSHALRMIRDILFFKPKGKGTDIAGALKYLNRVTCKRTIAFIVSDFAAPDFSRELKATSRKHDLVAVRVTDPREEKLEDVGLIALEDAETGETVILDTSDAVLSEKYEKSRRDEAGRLAKMFAAAKVDQISVGADKDFIGPLVKFFKARERKRRFG